MTGRWYIYIKLGNIYIYLYIELYYYLRILDTVLNLIIMCNLLIFKHFPEEDSQYINRKFGKIFTLLFYFRNFIKTETHIYIFPNFLIYNDKTPHSLSFEH